MTILAVLALLVLAAFLLYRGLAYWSWVVPAGGVFVWWWKQDSFSPWLLGLLALPYLLTVVVMGFPPLRRAWITSHVLRAMAPIFPSMSETERVALEAGTTWWDAELFSGAPDWHALVAHRRPGLTARERAFLANEVEEVCRMVDNEEIDQIGDLEERTWRFLKEKGFFGMIIPESHGGLGFSPEANSAVVTKVSSKSVTLAVTVMVPNSLGPAELLLHYGTEEQKKHYLPRLARGEEIPAFALTEAGAGSDASAMASRGVVCNGKYQGREVVGIRLNWNKRYITLAPVATLLGLAFKLYDPDHLIGDVDDLGITCALVPTTTAGVEIGRRHDPLGIQFLNGPTSGKDVFLPIDCIIGGRQMAGQGWRMLMDCLSAGRSISLPGLACGASQVACRAISAYALIREQFGLPLARFEGIGERLGRMAGKTWLMSAARRMTAGAVATGQRPSVISAIVKAYLTEGMREVINDAMDVQGGAGISRGARNVLARIYQALPIGITVEGANILTRTLIIYGQGALRCHPHAFKEMEAARKGDLWEFDRSFFAHLGFVATNACRAVVLALTRGRIASAPTSGAAREHFQDFSRLSAAFAVISDFAMGTLGGALKRKELITGRLADALAWSYLGSTCIKRYMEDGEIESDRPFLRYGCRLAAHNVEEALLGVLRNLPNRLVARVLRVVVFPLGRSHPPPSDRTTIECARAMVEDDAVRERLTADIHVPAKDEDRLGYLEAARRAVRAAEPARKRMREAQKVRALPRTNEKELVPLALERGLLSAAEAEDVLHALALQEEAIQVDSFALADRHARVRV